MKNVLVGFTYSLERAVETALAAGVRLNLPLGMPDKVTAAAEGMGLPMFPLPSFKEDPVAAAAELNELIAEHDIEAFWPLGMSAFDLSGLTACPVHAVTTPGNYGLIKDKAAFARWLGGRPDVSGGRRADARRGAFSVERRAPRLSEAHARRQRQPLLGGFARR